MKKIFPKVHNDQLLICVGDDEDKIEFVVGESILSISSEKEEALWKRAIRVSLIDSFEELVKLVLKGSWVNATETASLLKSTITEHDEHWQREVFKLKKMVEE